jgi:hypothetical protein
MNTITSNFGLNDLLCDHNAWIMTGIQYGDLSTKDGEVTGTTHWLAYRTFFLSSPLHFRTKKMRTASRSPTFFKFSPLAGTRTSPWFCREWHKGKVRPYPASARDQHPRQRIPA